jgi:hypothetical protein
MKTNECPGLSCLRTAIISLPVKIVAEPALTDEAACQGKGTGPSTGPADRMRMSYPGAPKTLTRRGADLEVAPKVCEARCTAVQLAGCIPRAITASTRPHMVNLGRGPYTMACTIITACVGEGHHL